MLGPQVSCQSVTAGPNLILPSHISKDFTIASRNAQIFGAFAALFLLYFLSLPSLQFCLTLSD